MSTSPPITRTEVEMMIEERLAQIHSELENIVDALTVLVEAVTEPQPAQGAEGNGGRTEAIKWRQTTS